MSEIHLGTPEVVVIAPAGTSPDDMMKIGDVAWVNFDVLYPGAKVSSEVRETWKAWFRHHTIDPAVVLMEGTLIVDFDHYRISYPSYDPDAEEWITLQRTLQLEARPSEPPCF